MTYKSVHLILGAILILLFLSFAKTYVKTQVIIVGYEIGRLKTQEALFLKKRSLLTMQLAKLTTKTQLEKLINK